MGGRLRSVAALAALAMLCAGQVAHAEEGAPTDYPISADTGTADPAAPFRAAVASAGGRVLAYQTGPNHPMPLLAADGAWRQSPFDARIVALPRDPAGQRLAATLLGNAAEGPDARCESNPDARTEDGTAQTAEVYGPAEAWQRLGRPAVLVNTNFFDVRPQRNGLTWRDTGCTTPFGVYYDNQHGGAAPERAGPSGVAEPPTSLAERVTGAPEQAAARLYLGRKGLTNELSAPWGTLATWVITDGAAPLGAEGQPPTAFEMFLAPAAEDNAVAEGWSDGIEQSDARVVAFAGLHLLHPSGDAHIHDPEVRTARSAVGYSPALDRLLLVQAGSNLAPETGMTRVELQDLFRALGATTALQLDSGGSSALVVGHGDDVVWAGEGDSGGGAAGGAPVGACPQVEGAFCSPGITAAGGGRKVPGWLGLGLDPGAGG